MNIEFNEKDHTYLVDSRPMPSVTQILDLLTYEDFAKIDRSTLEYASRRGTAIHEATEAYDIGGEVEVDAETEPYITAYIDFCHDYKPNYFGIEEQVVNTQQGYAGTVDRYGLLGERPFVLDIKTVASPNRLTYIKVCLQTYLYSLCTDYDNPMLLALFLKKDGTYRLFNCREWWGKNMKDPLMQSAISVLSAHKAIQRLKEKRSN